jgi:hypothetical protein
MRHPLIQEMCQAAVEPLATCGTTFVTRQRPIHLSNAAVGWLRGPIIAPSEYSECGIQAGAGRDRIKLFFVGTGDGRGERLTLPSQIWPVS